MLFKRMSDAELKENGFDPIWIAENEDREGPYAAIRVSGQCPCCFSESFLWTVVNLETGVGIAQDWGGSEGQTEAEETENQLNNVWLEGLKAWSRRAI